MKYIISFALTSLITFAGLYGLIMAVDPYNKLGNNLFGFHTKAVDFARENKFNQVEHGKKNYTLFLMGSSSAHRYQTKELNQLSGLVSYNYSTQSATPEDYLAMTRHILTKYSPKIIMISFDFEVLNKNTKTDDMFFSSPLKKFLADNSGTAMSADMFNNSYLTLEAIRDSFKVIWVNLFGKPLHAYLEDGDHVVEPLTAAVKITQFNDAPYEIDPQRVSYLKEILKLGSERGFKVIAFTSPLSIAHVEQIESMPRLKEAHQVFKQTLVDIFGEVYDFQNAGIRPYNTVTYFRDSNHPTHFFSTMVLQRIFGSPDVKNAEFGVLIKK